MANDEEKDLTDAKNFFGAKDFLYAWCGKNKLGSPNYESVLIGKNFVTTVKIVSLPGNEAEGTASARKMASSIAAYNLCERLIENGLMDKTEFANRKPNAASPIANSIRFQFRSPIRQLTLPQSGSIAAVEAKAESGVTSKTFPDGSYWAPPPRNKENEESTKSNAPIPEPVPPRQKIKRKHSESHDGPGTSNGTVNTNSHTTATNRAHVNYSGTEYSETYGDPVTKRARVTPSDDPVIIGESLSSRVTGITAEPVASHFATKRKESESSDGPGTSNGVVGTESHAATTKRVRPALLPNPETAGDESDDDVQFVDEKCIDDDDVQFVAQIMPSVRPFQDQLLHTLSADIMDHYNRNKQSQEIFNWKMQVLQSLSSAIGNAFRNPIWLFPVGSTVNQLGSYNSDMDLCLVMFKRDAYGDEYADDERSFMMTVLRSVKFALRPMRGNVKNSMIIQAKVPIVRFEYQDEVSSMEIDINCNNLTGIHNTHLLHYYSTVDERFPALSLVIKHWAIVSGINDASNGTLSSYALNLMIIHYLQYGVLQTHSYARPVLPNLQELFPDLFSFNRDVRALKVFKSLPAIPPLNNQMGTGDLLLGFFNYYANYFNFDTMVASVREGAAVRKGRFWSTKTSCLMCIEEPFERMNVARAVYAEDKRDQILSAIQLAYENLKRNPALESIGVRLAE